MKLNIGAGHVEIEGFEAVDRHNGQEAYPLEYPDNSADEIRASHILEHFSYGETVNVLRDWVRVLKPGGRIRIAVPDIEKLLKDFTDDPKFESYMMGGQTDANDYHRALFNEEKLRVQMEKVGIENIKPWVSENTDCASLGCSLNLEGVKSLKAAEPESVAVKTVGVMSIPRHGALGARGIIEMAFRPHGIPIHTTQGVFWGQCLQRMMEWCVKSEIDIILTIDYDTMATSRNVSDLLYRICNNNHIDALAALEPRQNGDTPLMTRAGETEVEITGEPVQAASAHFGLTAIRVESLRKVEKPWFFSQPAPDGTWEPDGAKIDADIWFWHQWKKAGNSIWVDPRIRIGHQEERVAYYDDRMELHRCSVPEWRKLFLTEAENELG